MKREFDKLAEEMQLINTAQFGSRKERKAANKEIQKRLDALLQEFKTGDMSELHGSYLWQQLLKGGM